MSRPLLAVLLSFALAGCASQTPALRSVTADLPQQLELTDTAFFPQEDYQCGPAALATVLISAGATVTPDALVNEVYLPGRQGSLQTEIIAATRTHGRMPYVLAPELEDIIAELAAGRPVLVLQNLRLRSWPAWHYAVVIGYDRSRERLILRSGTTRRELISTRKFQRTWELGGRWALVALEPGDVPARPELERYMTAAAGLEATGKADAASASYERARALWPQSPLPLLGTANLSYARGDLDTAQRSYAAALERDPANVAARNNLAETLARRGCVDDARQEIARALHFARGTALEKEVSSTARRLADMKDEGRCTGAMP